MNGIERLRLPDDDPTFGGNRIFDLFEYAPAVTAHGLVFIAGQIGLRADGSIPESPVEQIDAAFRRIEAILTHLGLDFSDVVEMVSYHVDVGAHLADFRAVKARYMRTDFPAWTILGVAALARPELVVEIKVVAATRAA
ncbi:RidA family protein [Burkholderia cenocepacia]|uniref:RidA family protein n=1 Tax=Burkholderia cenocepacia TaxID=95486 RepID=UPI001B9735E9|nr:RidA family protein [Burkholderia cenocepacia]MBR8401200.1 RidA family protein [Burkholderia cenocepacia]